MTVASPPNRHERRKLAAQQLKEARAEYYRQLERARSIEDDEERVAAWPERRLSEFQKVLLAMRKMDPPLSADVEAIGMTGEVRKMKNVMKRLRRERR